MLLTISKLLTGDLLKILCDMGHGDKIAIVDANFPANTNGKRVLQFPGIRADDLLKAILPLFPLDHVPEYAARLMDMDPKDKDAGMKEPELWGIFSRIVSECHPGKRTGFVPRDDFYAWARDCYAVIQTGEERLYGNIILAKGVVK